MGYNDMAATITEWEFDGEWCSYLLNKYIPSETAQSNGILDCETN